MPCADVHRAGDPCMAPRRSGIPGARRVHHQGRSSMAEETGQVTGTKDKDYNIIWFTEQCLSNALRLEQYAEDAERDGDSELAEFFKRAQAASQKGADEGKQHLRKRFSNGS